MITRLLTLFFMCALAFPLSAQEANYDESLIPDFQLPPLLTSIKGITINSPASWEKDRRPELIKLFSDEMFGVLPDTKVHTTYRTLEENHSALKGSATRKQIEISFEHNGITRKALVLLYLPNQVKTPAAVFLSPNFQGNQTVSMDPDIIPSQFSDRERGKAQSRWPLDKIIDAGYGVATVHYFDFCPDDSTRIKEGILPLLYEQKNVANSDSNGQAISAWAWGLSRIMDYLITDPQIDPSRVIVMGHSRLGKTALWAGANDSRFAMVISNNSGCGGAALSKRQIGENLAIINRSFPHWFCPAFKKYSNNEENLQFDQHQLLALIAPRPLYIASAEEDLWADPKGEFLSAYEAGSVYALYNFEGLPKPEMPAVNEPIHQRIGYHIRTGKHDVTDFDWDNYIIFANKWLK